MASVLSETQLTRVPSSSLGIVQPNDVEKLHIWTINAQSFRGALDPATYMQREEFLSKQLLTANGGITFWALTDLSKPIDERSILSSCETIEKRALVKIPGQNIQEITVSGIASVFCDPTYRGKGYATAMMKLLSSRLDQQYRLDASRNGFSILYSDIGQDFYKRLGWRPYESKHLILKPFSCGTSANVRMLQQEDVERICRRDEQMLRIYLEESTLDQTAVLLIPDHKTMAWLHARERFLATSLSIKLSPVVGAELTLSGGLHAWCIWSSFFAAERKADTLQILRFVIQGSDRDDGDHDLNSERYQATLILLRAAQKQASDSGLSQVQLWNPSRLTILVARQIQPLHLIDRETESIASLRICPQNSLEHPVRWLANEKFGWC